MIIPIVADYLPEYATGGSSGVDLQASHETWIPPHGQVLVRTGIRVKIPEGWELQIRPRSGLALKHWITVLNTPGTIDSDFINELGVILINHHPYHFFKINKGDRIAQAVLCPVGKIEWEVVDELEETKRSGGFGSTG